MKYYTEEIDDIYSMTNENHTKIVNIPYPGRDLAIVALVFTVLLPLVGPLIGFIAARRSIDESKARGYSQIGIQKFAYSLSGLIFLIELVIILVFILVGRGLIPLELFSFLSFTPQ